MAVMSRQDMRDFVRSNADVDSNELPDVLVDRFLADGDNRVDSYSRRWQFREVDYNVPTVADEATIDLYTAPGITTPLLDVVDVRSTNHALVPKDHRQMRARFRANGATSGDPQFFSRWGHTLYLWPTPSSIIQLSITGYRQKTDWLATNGTPDYPEEFHELIAWWALNRAHAFLDYPEMASFYREEFLGSLKERAKVYTEGMDAQPLIVNGGGGRESLRAANGLGALRFDWE